MATPRVCLTTATSRTKTCSIATTSSTLAPCGATPSARGASLSGTKATGGREEAKSCKTKTTCKYGVGGTSRTAPRPCTAIGVAGGASIAGTGPDEGVEAVPTCSISVTTPAGRAKPKRPVATTRDSKLAYQICTTTRTPCSSTTTCRTGTPTSAQRPRGALAVAARGDGATQGHPAKRRVDTFTSSTWGG